MTVRMMGRLSCLIIALALTGCGGPKGNFATITGKITQGGAPLDGAKVRFHATVEVGGKRETYSAITDSSGKYVLLANGADPGIPPGLYKVTIVKQGFKVQNPDDPGMDAGQMEAQQSAIAGSSKVEKPKEYENEASTKLSVTLETGKNEGKDFDIPK